MDVIYGWPHTEFSRIESRDLQVIALNVLGFSSTVRCSCPEVFSKKDVLRNFAKFTGKYQCHSILTSGIKTKVTLP